MARIAKKLFDRQKQWEVKVGRSKKVIRNWKELFNVDLARQYLDGQQAPTGDKTNPDWITINNVYAHLKATLPSLYSADPYFYVRLKSSFNPTTMIEAGQDPQTKEAIIKILEGYEKKGRMRQAMLNYLKEELKLKSKMRLSIQDALFQIGVMKTEFFADIKENEKYGQPLKSEGGEPLKDPDNDDEYLMEPEHLLDHERYSISRIHPDNIIIDEDAGPLECSWKWIAEEINTTLGELKKDKRFDKRAIKLLEGKAYSEDEEDRKREERKKGNDISGKSERAGEPTEKKKPNDSQVKYWEIYDLMKKTWSCIASGGEIPLVDNAPIPKGVEDHPYSFLRFTMRDDSPWPIPPMSQGIDLCREYNMARSDIQKHRKRFNRKYEVLQQLLADNSDAVSLLESGADGTVIPVNQLGAVQPIKDAPLDQMRYQELGYLRNEMIQVFGGSTDEARGIAGADSATQAGILDKRLEVKEGDAMSMVIDFTKDIAKKLDQLVQANITKDMAVKVTGPDGEKWELIKETDYEKIEGEYEYDVNVGATIPRMPQMERSSWMAFLTLLQNFPQLLLADRLMKRMAEMHHIEDNQMLDELKTIGQKMMSGQLPQPGQSGSQPGQGEERPQSAMGGMAAGAGAPQTEG